MLTIEAWPTAACGECSWRAGCRKCVSPDETRVLHCFDFVSEQRLEQLLEHKDHDLKSRRDG